MGVRNRRLAELALFVAAAVLHTWPLASAPASLGRVDNADTALNAWIIAWVGHQLPRDPLHLFDANIFYPEPNTLAFSELMLPQALLAAPLTWLGTDPVLVYNLLVIAGFALSGWAMSWLVARWTGDRAAGLVAGLAYAFNAHILVRFGHLQAMHVQFLPLAIFALDRLLTRPGLRWAAILAALCVLQALTANYLLVMTAFAMVAAAAVRRETWRGDQLTALVTAGGLSAIALVPFLLPYYDAHTHQGLVRSFEDVAMYSATWRDWLSTAGRLHYAWWSYRWYGATSALFPGATVVVLAAVALWRGFGWRDHRGRMVLAIGVVGVLLSFGANLPGYRTLYDIIPLLKGIRVVSRFGWLTLFALPIFAGFGLAWLRTRVSRPVATAVALAAGLLVTVEAARAPMGFAAYTGIPPIYDRIAALPNAVIAELPFPPRAAIQDNGPAVLYSARHFKPLLNGYSGFTPASYLLHFTLMQQLPAAESTASLRAVGVTHLVVHERRVTAALLDALAAAPALHLVAIEDGVRLYALGERSP